MPLPAYTLRRGREPYRETDYNWVSDRENGLITYFDAEQRSIKRTACSYSQPQKVWSVFRIGPHLFDDHRKLFDRLVERWQDDTAFESSLTAITANRNYLRIIAMGEIALPFIFERLQREPEPWFVALRAISGEDNIGREHPGDFEQMAKAWLEWGARKGYI